LLAICVLVTVFFIAALESAISSAWFVAVTSLGWLSLDALLLAHIDRFGRFAVRMTNLHLLLACRALCFAGGEQASLNSLAANLTFCDAGSVAIARLVAVREAGLASFTRFKTCYTLRCTCDAFRCEVVCTCGLVCSTLRLHFAIVLVRHTLGAELTYLLPTLCASPDVEAFWHQGTNTLTRVIAPCLRMLLADSVKCGLAIRHTLLVHTLWLALALLLFLVPQAVAFLSRSFLDPVEAR